MVHDNIAHIIYGEYSPALNDALNTYREIALKNSLINRPRYTDDKQVTYSPLLLKESMLTQEAFTHIVGGRPKKLNTFFEEGQFNLIDYKTHSCVFCDYNPKEDILEREKVLFDNIIPQASTDIIHYPVKVCESCLVHLYFLSTDISFNASIDCCKSCRGYYLVEPDEYERRISLTETASGRGIYTCDGCLIDAGFGNTKYVRQKTCVNCTKDTSYNIALTEIEEMLYLCSDCENNHNEDAGFNDLNDEQSEKIIRDQIKLAKEHSVKYGYEKVEAKTLGNGYGMPENIYIQIYELFGKSERCVTYNLVEIVPWKLEAIKGNTRAITIDMISLEVLKYIPRELQYNVPRINKPHEHDEYFTFTIQGFESLRKSAREAANVILLTYEIDH